MTYHMPNDLILLERGFVPAQQITAGDLLYNPTGPARKVIGTNYQTPEILYQIETKNRQVFYVGPESKLFLERTNSKVSDRCYQPHQIVTISEYLKKSEYFKHLYKLKFQTVDFIDQPVPIDPYFLGLLLGDGSIGKKIGITTADAEIEQEIIHQANCFDLNLRIEQKSGANCKTFYFSRGNVGGCKNPIAEILRSLNLYQTNSESKFVPDMYIRNTTAIRKEILAGLIDTDGSKFGNGGYDFISKSQKLSEGVIMLARSLGYRATYQLCRKSCQTGTSGEYHRVTISAANDLPVRIKRKQSQSREQKKDISRVGFSITEISPFEIIQIISDRGCVGSNFIVLV